MEEEEEEKGSEGQTETNTEALEPISDENDPKSPPRKKRKNLLSKENAKKSGKKRSTKKQQHNSDESEDDSKTNEDVKKKGKSKQRKTSTLADPVLVFFFLSLFFPTSKQQQQNFMFCVSDTFFFLKKGVKKIGSNPQIGTRSWPWQSKAIFEIEVVDKDLTEKAIQKTKKLYEEKREVAELNATCKVESNSDGENTARPKRRTRKQINYAALEKNEEVDKLLQEEEKENDSDKEKSNVET
ncbi:hypothetical protein RFI_20962 [Reticulomyxa filosa]|uniref:Uncharacterized protein n=1 Tax=Reticulomyxa filosa TaxID=46433 RepID=X6MRH6_RETFI|nr:hypothetical protein RFI_20962 [Reticulomyxa filosa]|eukprot:ETO16389.1 hypothetical protein RFI_20962 [Reticulomyxa filosa]